MRVFLLLLMSAAQGSGCSLRSCSCHPDSSEYAAYCASPAGIGYGEECPAGGVSYSTCGDCAGCGASSAGDPHLTFAHGGHADYRGEHEQFFNFLSAANTSVNVRFKNASFSNGFQDIDGTYITEAHAVYRTINGSFFNVSFHSDKLRPKISGAKGVAERPGFIISTCVPAGGSALPDPADASEDQRALLDIGDVERCDEAVAQVEKDGTLTLTFLEWILRIKPKDVYHSGKVTTWSHKIDLQMSPRVPEADMKVKPHGIIGQSFDGDDVGINGKQDPYTEATPGPLLVTSAMAEGAIEGEAAEYKMPSKFATAFKYSRFDRLSAPYRDVAALKGTKVKASAAQRSAGAANTLEGEVHQRPRVEL